MCRFKAEIEQKNEVLEGFLRNREEGDLAREEGRMSHRYPGGHTCTQMNGDEAAGIAPRARGPPAHPPPLLHRAQAQVQALRRGCSAIPCFYAGHLFLRNKGGTNAIRPVRVQPIHRGHRNRGVLSRRLKRNGGLIPRRDLSTVGESLARMF